MFVLLLVLRQSLEKNEILFDLFLFFLAAEEHYYMTREPIVSQAETEMIIRLILF